MKHTVSHCRRRHEIGMVQTLLEKQLQVAQLPIAHYICGALRVFTYSAPVPMRCGTYPQCIIYLVRYG
jgi:hypothetical protein